MTPAEFDTRRRLLGLSVEEAADWCGANRITVQRWQKGAARIAPAAIARLEVLEDAMASSVDRAVDLARAMAGGGQVELYRYRTQDALDASPNGAGMPLGAHAMMIGWTADALEAEGFTVVIAWAD